MFRVIKKFLTILSTKQKIYILFLVFLMILGAIFETLGISMIVPLMTSILDKDFYINNQYAHLFCEPLGINTGTQFMIVVLIGVALIFAVKDSFLFLQNVMQARFICKNKIATQKMVLESIISKPYVYFLDKNSGELVRRIGEDVASSYVLLSTLLSFMTELLIAIVIVITIVAISPQMALVVLAILLFEVLIIYKIIKPILGKAGMEFQKNTAQVNKWMLQSISGIKELKVSRKEDFFVGRFEHYSKKRINSEKKSLILNSLPKLLIEAVTIDSIIVYMILMLLGGKEMETLIPQFSAFAVAAVRLLPAANRISSSMSDVAYREPTLDNLIESLSEIKNSFRQEKKLAEIRDLTFKEEIRLNNVSFKYPNTDKFVLENAEMIVPFGKSVGIIGKSGAGKTTAVDILMGLLHTTNGDVNVDENSIWSNYNKWLSLIGYIPQTIYLLDDSIRANVAFGVPQEEIDDESVIKALKDAELYDYILSLPDGIETTIGERGIRLSGGQRQRLGIARALYNNPSILVLDEATSALDNETEAAIMKAIYSLHGKKTLIIIAHRLTTIRNCDIVYRVEDGKIVQTIER